MRVPTQLSRLFRRRESVLRPSWPALRFARRSTVTSMLVLAGFGFASFGARAEGRAQVGSAQALEEDTVMYVDILATTEQITWDGPSGVQIDLYRPDGTLQGTYSRRTAITPGGGVGAYRIEIHEAGTGDLSSWDVTVTGAASGRGRLWSYDWHFNAGSFSSSAATNGSFYARVPDGSGTEQAVIEMKTDGLAGYDYHIIANHTGLPDGRGRSLRGADVDETDVLREVPIYLQPPEDATYSWVSPTAGELAFTPSVCGGGVGGEFSFTTNVVAGNFHIVCDADENGVYDITSSTDVHILGETVVGTNVVTWDGNDAAGDAVASGDYACRVFVTVGEFHYVGYDIETSYDGFRLFGLDSGLTRTGLAMYWNDVEVQSLETSTMPGGETSLAASGTSGIDSGAYGSAAVANVNARAWGSFDETSKGNETWLDTYTWLEASAATTLAIDTTLDACGESVCDDGSDDDLDGLTDCDDSDCALDEACLDSDSDGLTDAEERDIGTNPLDPDTDDGGVTDGDEVAGGADPLDASDDTCWDNDLGDVTGMGVASGTTVSMGDDRTPTCASSSAPDVAYLWTAPATGTFRITTDGSTYDTMLTVEEPVCTDADVYQCDDDDGEGRRSLIDIAVTEGEQLILNVDGFSGEAGTYTLNIYQLVDTDGDGLYDFEEDALGTDPDDADTDDDGLSDGDEVDTLATDPLDMDSDADGLTDGQELGLTEGLDDTDPDLFVADVDPTTTTDPTLADTDGDGLVDGDEDEDLDGTVGAGETDPDDADTDDGGMEDGEEVDLGRDPLFGGDDDGDSDDDGILDDVEGGSDTDTDGDGTPDRLDDDSDGDGIPDSVEGTTDTDGDGTPDFLDTDDDGDGVPTADERGRDSDGDGTPDNLDTDDDGDGLPTADELPFGDTDGDGTPDFLDTDDDGDGLPTTDETARGTDPRDTDSDDDGLSDSAEVIAHGTDPLDTDSDDDGLSDGAEVGDAETGFPGTGTDPLDADSDDDGLTDGAEVNEHGTDPLDTDSDDDGLTDGDEVGTDDAPGTGTDPTNEDTDGDGLLDGAEVTEHGTDPTDADSDNDRLSDGDEVTEHGTDPTDADSDDDTIEDGDEVLTTETDPMDEDSDDDGISDDVEATNARDQVTAVDTDGDNRVDGRDTDADDDGILDAVEGTDDSDGDGKGDWRDVDSDGDGLSDELEGEVDTDGDAVPDYLDVDSDGDGLSDAIEADEDTDSDGTRDSIDLDSDEDGIADADESESDGGPDTDSDGTPDWRDLDTDGDGIDDSAEGNVDTDNDGMPDFRDLDSDGDGYDDSLEAEYASSGKDVNSVPPGAYNGGCSSTGADPAGGAAGVALAAVALATLRRRRNG